MKYNDLFRFFKGLQDVGLLKGVKFAYGRTRTLDFVRPMVENARKTLEPYDDYNKYEEARLELCKKLAKQEDGKPVVKKISEKDSFGNVGIVEKYVFDDREKFDVALKKLQKTHQKALDDREKQVEDFNKMMDEEMKKPPEIHKVKLDDFPKDIDGDQMDSVREMIDDS